MKDLKRYSRDTARPPEKMTRNQLGGLSFCAGAALVVIIEMFFAGVPVCP